MNELMTNGVNLNEENADADLSEENSPTAGTPSHDRDNDFSPVSEARSDTSDTERTAVIQSDEKADHESEVLQETGSEVPVPGNSDMSADTLSVPDEKSDTAAEEVSQNVVFSDNTGAIAAEDTEAVACETGSGTASPDGISNGSEVTVLHSSENSSENSDSLNNGKRQPDLEKLRFACFKKKGKKFKHRR